MDEELRTLLAETHERAVAYLDRLDERPVAPTSEARAALSRFHEPLPEEPTAARDVLALLDDIGSPATTAVAGGRYFGYVIGGVLPAALGANWLAGAWDQPTGLYDFTPATATLEIVALDWLIELLGLPSDCGGGFVTGATMANFSALAAARHAVLGEVGWNVEADGLFGAPPITVIVGEETHPTLFKSLGMLGLGRERVVRVPVDDQGRMLADALPPVEGPTIVCTQAGNVNSGAFDPVGEIARRVRPEGAWVHVDGAFGLWAMACPRFADEMAGTEEADSWATDAHKTLNVPYDSGLVFLRRPELLRAAMAVTAEYLPTTTRRQPSDYTPELSRRARGVEVWAALRQLGRSGFVAMVERLHDHALRFAAGLEEGGHEVLNEVVFNQVVVAFGDAATTERVIAAIQADGSCWCGPTEWRGRRAMRISVSSWRTSDEDVERSLRAIIDIAAEVIR